MSYIDPTAEVAADVVHGDDTLIWGLAQVRERAVIGSNVVIGRGVYVGVGVRIGDRVKIQNFAQVYEPAEIADGVFIGPAVVLTNDQYPRAITPDGRSAGASDWTPVGVTIAEGASVGARSVCVAPVRIGRWALVGAGSVVTSDVPDHALVVGNPARQIGWVGRAGRRLVADADGLWRCQITGQAHRVGDNGLEEVSDG